MVYANFWLAWSILGSISRLFGCFQDGPAREQAGALHNALGCTGRPVLLRFGTDTPGGPPGESVRHHSPFGEVCIHLGLGEGYWCTCASIVTVIIGNDSLKGVFQIIIIFMHYNFSCINRSHYGFFSVEHYYEYFFNRWAKEFCQAFKRKLQVLLYSTSVCVCSLA